jgi:DNA invertase Pin-like site-specific DNA recombinase
MSTVRCACYVRVSTASKSRQRDTFGFDQNADVQEQPLRELIAQRRWELYRVYSDRANGVKESRPGCRQGPGREPRCSDPYIRNASAQAGN